jgi:pyruvate ferredoxin oxidoreductase gamma subunit
LTRFVHFDSVKRAIEEAFPGKVGAANVAAAIDAHDFVLSQQRASDAA